MFCYCVEVLQSTKKCIKQCSPEIRVHKTSVYDTVRHKKLKLSARNLPQAKNEDSQLPVEFIEWLWHVK